jgi:hypothetical protein
MESNTQNLENCACLELAFVRWEFDERYLGTDRYYADISVRTCKLCGRHWLNYHYENEAFTASGRWYRGLIPPDQVDSVSAEGAREFLGKLDWYLCGGSFYGKVFKASGVPSVWP